MVILPPFVYYITYRWAIGLQRSDRMCWNTASRPHHQAAAARCLHRAAPAARPVDDHGHPIPLEYQARRCPSE